MSPKPRVLLNSPRGRPPQICVYRFAEHWRKGVRAEGRKNWRQLLDTQQYKGNLTKGNILAKGPIMLVSQILKTRQTIVSTTVKRGHGSPEAAAMLSEKRSDPGRVGGVAKPPDGICQSVTVDAPGREGSGCLDDTVEALNDARSGDAVP